VKFWTNLPHTESPVKSVSEVVSAVESQDKHENDQDISSIRSLIILGWKVRIWPQFPTAAAFSRLRNKAARQPTWDSIWNKYVERRFSYVLSSFCNFGRVWDT